MKLLHVTTVPLTLRFLRGQVGFMQERGLEIHVATSEGTELDAFADEEQVAAHVVEMERRIALGADLKSLWALYKIVRKLKPDIVHSHTPKGGLLGMLAASLAQTPARYYHMRGLPFSSATGFKKFVLRQTERVSCALADEVFCVSNSLRDEALRERLCRPDKIRVLGKGSGNGVDAVKAYNPAGRSPEEVNGLRESLGIKRRAQVLGFVGRLTKDKGLVELWEAWSMLREDFGQLELVLVGDWEEQDCPDMEVVNGFRADPRVHCTGWVPSAAPYYPLFGVLTLPTYREGFPNVLLEAAAMEVPVVATSVPGCVDAVEEGETGSLVPPQNSKALAVAISNYLKNPLHAKATGMRARKRVLQNYSQDVIWQALWDRYAAHPDSQLPPARVRKAQA